MSDVATTVDEIPAPPPPGAVDALDEALAELPAPPRARRAVLGVLLTGISIASIFLAAQFKDDVLYAMSSSTPVSLGDGRTAAPTAADANRFVTLRATASMAGAVEYSRPLFGSKYQVFRVAARNGEPIYIQVDSDQADEAIAQGEFQGRLIPFGAAGGRYAGVGRYLRDNLRAPVNNRTWLLVDGAAPRTNLWAPAVASLLMALALSDLLLLGRLFRSQKP